MRDLCRNTQLFCVMQCNQNVLFQEYGRGKGERGRQTKDGECLARYNDHACRVHILKFHVLFLAPLLKLMDDKTALDLLSSDFNTSVSSSAAATVELTPSGLDSEALKVTPNSITLVKWDYPEQNNSDFL